MVSICESKSFTYHFSKGLRVITKRIGRGLAIWIIAQSIYEMWLPTRSAGPSHGIFCTPVTRNL